MGKNKIRETFLPFHVPSISEEEIQEVTDTLRTGWITTGPKTKLFEEKFSKYVGSKYAIAVNSCTAGLHLALVAAGISQGDEVITTPFTFAATGEVIIHAGAKPVFVDVEPTSLNIDPLKIEKAITTRTKAIMPVHYAGLPCRMAEILEIASAYNLIVIEDAAHAIGAEYLGKKIGTLGDITVFSFYATKNLTTGEGGMVTTNNEELAEKIRILSLHGLSRDAWKRYTAEGSWYYEILFAGYKYNLSDIQAAIGLHQLNKFEQFQKTREEYVQIYNQGFKNLPEITLPRNDGNRHAWHLYVIKLNLDLLNISRNNFIKALSANNIGTSVHFIPLHLHPYYKQKFDFKMGDFPIAEEAFQRVISLPLYPAMTPKDVQDVICIVREILDKNRK